MNEKQQHQLDLTKAKDQVKLAYKKLQLAKKDIADKLLEDQDDLFTRNECEKLFDVRPDIKYAKSILQPYENGFKSAQEEYKRLQAMKFNTTGTLW